MILRQVLRDVQGRHPFHMDAVVVLPDHIHAIWTLPPGDADFPTRWMLVKSAFSRRYAQTNDVAAPGTSRLRRRERAIWQRRFWEHQIRDERDFASHVDYIHYNPVKHGWVSRPIDWPHSTLHGCIEREMATADWGGVINHGALRCWVSRKAFSPTYSLQH